MIKKRIAYLSCTSDGKESMEGEIIGHKAASNHNKWRENIKNTKCEICNKQTTNGQGIYILKILFKNVINTEYYCYQCSRDNNLFKEYKGEFEEFNYKRDIGL